ncbi:Flagellar biosynthesis/type III secretory pathway protein-like protein [Candidatus Sulfopaludibacter sp. SbA3]|nr:Flagellar biosynthesis/type III secretory pathway protein-like protein [Candidatus Sulfopaludibacter sp. SbA3]
MLSKVLKGAVDLAPVPWRDRVAPVAPPSRPEAPVAGDDEATHLRAKIAELEAILETQSRQAYEAGVRAGEVSARQALESGVREITQGMAAAIADLAGTRAETMRRAEGDTVRLAIEIARRVLHRELSIDVSALEALIKAALEKLQSQEVYRVRVHPDQEKLVRACLDQTGRGQAIAVVGDPVQPQGGAVFDISRGSLDASVETQLAEIERGLIDQLEARS